MASEQENRIVAEVMDRKLPDYLRAWLADFLNTHDLV